MKTHTKGPEKVSFLCKEADSMYRIIGIIIVTTAFIWWIYKVDKSLKK